MSVDLNAFVQPPVSPQHRFQLRSRIDSTDSVAGEVEKENLLSAFDSQINAAVSINQSSVDATVDSENVALWTRAITHWMHQHQGQAVSLLQLQQALGMPLVDIWLEMLLFNRQQYQWQTTGDFYHNTEEIWLVRS